MRNPLRAMAATTLICEALVVFFAGLVAMRLSDLSMSAALGLTGALAVLLVLAAGLLRSPLGYGFGSVLQVAMIGLGIWVPDMFWIGPLFAAGWVISLWYGAKVIRERAIVAAGLPQVASAAVGSAGQGSAGPESPASGSGASAQAEASSGGTTS